MFLKLLESIKNVDTGFTDLEWELRFCISNKIPVAANAAHLQKTLEVARISMTWAKERGC